MSRFYGAYQRFWHCQPLPHIIIPEGWKVGHGLWGTGVEPEDGFLCWLCGGRIRPRTHAHFHNISNGYIMRVILVILLVLYIWNWVCVLRGCGLDLPGNVVVLFKLFQVGSGEFPKISRQKFRLVLVGRWVH